MFSYFTAFLKPRSDGQESRRSSDSSGQNAEYAVSSYLLINELAANKNYAHLKSAVTVSFSDIFSAIKDIPSLFKNLKDVKLKNEFLASVKKYINEWPDIFIKLFSYSQQSVTESITAQLEEAGFNDKLSVLCNDCFNNFRDNREAIIWLYKNARDKSWFKNANIGIEKQLITLIHVLDVTYRDIDNHKDTVENKKINKSVYNILFKEGKLEEFINTSDEDAIIRIFTFINGVKDLDPQDKHNLRVKILEKNKDFKFFAETEKKVSVGFMVTIAMYDEKKKQLNHIMEVEVPANSKEIEYALSLGDLRENAEYKAAKEKQDQLNYQMTKLKEEIDKAQLFDPKTVNASIISFGTKVILNNEKTGRQEEYTILGQWESDSNKNIISYLSPFGNAILNKKEGDRFEFAINDERISYLVEKISPADF